MAFSQHNSRHESIMNESNQSRATHVAEQTTNPSTDRSMFSARSRSQLGLFLAGAGFFVMSTLITRRALLRRYKATIPPFYHPNSQPRHVNGAADAAQALGLASLNVSSFAMMGTGGTLWAFDISSMEDLRRKVRGGLGIDGTGKSEEQAEEDMEEWLATVLSRKDDKEKKKATTEMQQSKNGNSGTSQ